MIEWSMLIGATVICGLLALGYWPLSATILNWFQQDLLAEAKAIIDDTELQQCYSSQVSARTYGVLVVLLWCVAVLLLHQQSALTGGNWIKFCLCCYLLLLGLIDYRSFVLPDLMVYLGLWLGMLTTMTPLAISSLSLQAAVVGAVLGYLMFWILLHGGRMIMGKDVLGHGDCKLVAMLGAWLGFGGMMVAVLLASCAIFVQGVFLLVRARLSPKSQQQYLPFGPHLVFGAVLVVLFHDALLPAVYGFAGLMVGL